MRLSAAPVLGFDRPLPARYAQVYIRELVGVLAVGLAKFTQ